MIVERLPSDPYGMQYLSVRHPLESYVAAHVLPHPVISEKSHCIQKFGHGFPSIPVSELGPHCNVAGNQAATET